MFPLKAPIQPWGRRLGSYMIIRRCDIQPHSSDVDPQEGRLQRKSSPGEDWKLKLLLRPRNETFQVRLANTSNWVDVRYNVRGTLSEQRIKEKPETDLKNNRIWSNNHASCAPINISEKNGNNDAGSEHTRTFHLRSRSLAREAPPCDREPTEGAAQRSMLLPSVNAPGYSATRGSLHCSRHVLGSAVARLSRPERGSEAPLRFCPCSYPCGS